MSAKIICIIFLLNIKNNLYIIKQGRYLINLQSSCSYILFSVKILGNNILPN